MQREIFFGLLAAAVNIVGFFPYLRDILQHKTKPERATWWIYSVLFFLLLAAQRQAGAGWLLLASGAYVVTAVSIALLSLTYGYGRFHVRHIVAILVSILGLILWQLTDRPLFAIVMVILVDFAGFWLTLVKTWHAPHSETLVSWQLALTSYCLSFLAIETWTIDIVLYPIYAVLGGSAIVWVITSRRKIIKQDPKDF